MTAAVDLGDERRIARVRAALNTAIADTCDADAAMTYGDLMDALTGVAYRYAQHFRRTDAVPVTLPAAAPTAPPGGPQQAVRVVLPATWAEQRLTWVRPGDTVHITVAVPVDLPAGVTVEVTDQRDAVIAAGTVDAAGGIAWHLERTPPAGTVQISAVLLAALGAAGPAGLAQAAELLAAGAAGDLVLIAGDVPAGELLIGEEVIIDGDRVTAPGFAVAVRRAGVPAAALVTGDPGKSAAACAADRPAVEAPPDTPGAGLCGRCGSPQHRVSACDADDFTAAAWLGRD